MTDERIARLNALAKKAKGEGLTAEETAERDTLRKEYVAAFRANLVAQLEHTYIVDEQGNKHKLKRKDEE